MLGSRLEYAFCQLTSALVLAAEHEFPPHVSAGQSDHRPKQSGEETSVVADCSDRAHRKLSPLHVASGPFYRRSRASQSREAEAGLRLAYNTRQQQNAGGAACVTSPAFGVLDELL
jgi:hypothetical protein